MRKPYTIDSVVRLVIGIVIFLGILWLINYLKAVLLPFLVACLIAYILEPFVQYNRKLFGLKGRIVAIFITLFEFTFLITTLCCIFVPRIISEFHEVAAIFQHYATSAAKVEFIPDEVHEFIRKYLRPNEIAEKLMNQEWMNILDSALTASWGIITGSFTLIMGLFNWLITFLYIIFVMIDYERLGKGFRKMVPPRYRKTVFKIAGDVKRSMNHYFRGQSLIATIVGVLFAIGFSIINLPLAILLGLMIGVMNMVPYLQLVSIIPTTLLCLVYSASGGGDFWVIFWECMAVYCIVQAIQDLFLTPKIMGKAMGLNPAIILLSLSIWGALLGIIGLIIALPLTTLLIAYYNEYVIERSPYESKSAKRSQIKAVEEITNSENE